MSSASGYRNTIYGGSLSGVMVYGLYTASSSYGRKQIYGAFVRQHSSEVGMLDKAYHADCFPVRCVQELI